jgi:DNA-binding LacI/PurR family transcriptional regulator
MSTLIDRHLKIPKYLLMAERLRQQIADGTLRPGDQLPSFSEMKLQFEAAQHTVEKAHGLLEADGLIRREPGRGIFVNQPALREATGNVGFLAPHHMEPQQNLAYWGSLLAGMRSQAAARDYHLLMIDNSGTFNQWKKIDGAILCDTHDPRDPHPGLPQLPKDFPFVSIINKTSGIACVGWDDFDGAYQLTRHLLQLGHRRIAFLGTFNAGLSQLQKRKAGYLQALQEAHIEPNAHWMREVQNRKEWRELPTWYLQAGEFYMRRWLEEDWAELGCTALIAQNDKVARGAISVLQAAGIDVPRDVSVTGFDGLPEDYQTPLLTTIEVPLHKVGELAMASLLDWLQNPQHPPEDVCLPIKFVEGQCAAPKKELIAV